MIPETFTTLARIGGRGGRGFLVILLIALLGGLAALLIRRRRGGVQHRPPGQSADGILDDRFAKGEIDRDEYEHRRAVLAGDDKVPPAPSRSATAIADRPASDEAEATDDAGSDGA